MGPDFLLLGGAIAWAQLIVASEPRCATHGCHPHECFRQHHPQAYRDLNTPSGQ